MNSRLAKIVLMAALLVSALSCGRKRVIPEEDLSEIFAEMYLFDQWLESSNRTKGIDTFFVYGGILDKYGYDDEDLRNSLYLYLEDTEHFSEILDGTRDILKAGLSALEARDSLIARGDSIRDARRAKLKLMDLPVMYRDLLTGSYLTDSVAPLPDSVKYGFTVAYPDTMYNGPAMVLREYAGTDSTAASIKVETIDEVPDFTSIAADGRKAIPLEAPLPLERPERIIEK